MKISLTLLAGLLVTGCASNTGPERACTLIGCENGINLQVTSSAAQSMSVKVSTIMGQPMYSFTCQAGQPCQAFISGQTPQEVRVTVTTAQGDVTRTFKPEYQISKPNGPDCPPDCKQATIVVALT